MYCQLVYICGCIPARIRHALADLPETLDETYERTLREINKADWEFAHRLFQFVAVAVRPLFVEELAELLAFDFKAGSIPKFHDDWRLEDPMHAILSTCPSFLGIVDGWDKMYSRRKVVQFSHFSVKEFLTSDRLSESNDINLRRYHISETPAHTLAASACLGYLLHVDSYVTLDGLDKVTFAEYSSQHWVDHAHLEDVSRYVKGGLKELFDPGKPHLAFYIWIREKSLPHYERSDLSKRPSPLNYAALWDLHFIVEMLINELSQNVDSRNFTDSATPLHVASKCGHLEVARMLIERGASISPKDKGGCTPLHLASEKGHLEVVHMLIEHGADVSAQDRDGHAPLHMAFRRVEWKWTAEVAYMLIERGADVLAQNKDGCTPLHLASKEGQPDVVGVLIERGANVSARDKNGCTPLHLTWNVKVARMLIERGADVSAQDKSDQTPLHWVCQAEIVRMLIEHGADVSAQNNNGLTPLHLASQNEELEVVGILIEGGADLSAKDKDGCTPLHLATHAVEDEAKLKVNGASWWRREVVGMLIERGADVSAQDNNGSTPLHRALHMGAVKVAHMLIERGADLSAQDKDGHTPLHLAHRTEETSMLIEYGADVSIQDKDGHTPLHLIWGTEAARTLIGGGADVSAQDKDGHTPLHRALQNGLLDFALMLIEGGADLSAQDKEGHTPLHLASQA